MTKIKRIMAFLICFCLSFAIGLPASLAEESEEASPPIASGEANQTTKVYWGKGDYYPVVGTLYKGDEIDIYEYDKEWILTRYETWVTYGGQTVSHEFYGYVNRAHITCDPKLEGDASKKAERGPGKRKGKKWKPKNTPAPSPTGSASPTNQPESPQPTVETEDLMEYDWIIRTPGVCQVVVNAEGVKFVARFNLMAMKFGGYTASSLPTYNDGKQNPYCGYVSLTMKQNMQEFLSDNNLGFLQGSGGISIDAYNNNARFQIESQKDDATSTIITINVNATSVLNPMITDEQQGIQVGGEMFTDTRVMPLDIKLVKSGSGYQFVLLNMRPGGGDLKYPAMLEKYPLDDITKAERERIRKEQQDAERQRKAREAQEKALEEQRRKAQEGMDEKMAEEGKKGEKNDSGVAPGVPDDEDIELAPLTPPEDFTPAPLVPPAEGSGDEDIELAPLVPPAEGSGDEDIELAPLVPPAEGSGDEDIELAPLVPPAPTTGGGTSENAEFFPGND